MKIDLERFLKDSGVTEPFYPGKRLVVPCRQPGDFKSHSVIMDWRDPAKIRVEVKAGLSGRVLEDKILKKYPVSFQSPTFVEIEVVSVNDNDDEDEESKGSQGKSSGGGKKPAQKKSSLESLSGVTSTFGQMVEGKIPNLGKVVEMVVMGTKIAAEAFEQVFETLAAQINHAKICTTELLSKAGGFVTKYTPPSFMEPKGNEEKQYKYDREKNANIGFRPTFG